ncbi:hypothetical protein ARMGADRAFT_1086896 [Armillaria gallica]|uniref:SAM domain-containing protein n=1 Tax=Armillaria gallica TaxID=47427 RepID=A0A2H3D5T1_ARMGA|nr:hypothetical protein ARMGADRAFT_1086896 [Armillaria gallica]
MEHIFCGALNIPLDTSGDSEPPAETFQAYDDLNMYELDDIFTSAKEVRTVGDHHSGKDNLEDTNGDIEEEQDELGSDSTTSDNDGDLCLGEPSFEIPFEVPYKNATCQLSGISSHTSFPDFLCQVAQHMGCGLMHLSSIGYIESYHPKTPKPVPRMLEESEDFIQLKLSVQEYREMSLAKNKGKGKIKAFTISIIDTSHDNMKEGKKKTRGKDDNGDNNGGQGEKTAFASPEVDVMKQVETANHCEQHKRPYLVLDDGSHYNLTIEDVSIWAYVAVKNKLQVKHSKPPDDLKLHDKIGNKLSCQRSAKKAQAADQMEGSVGFVVMQVADPANMNAWLPSILSAVTVANALSQSLNPGMAPSTPQTSVARVIGSSVASLLTPQPSCKGGHPLSSSLIAAPSSNKRYLSSQLVDCPEMDVWLQSLDKHPHHGKYKVNYQQFLPICYAHGMYDVGDITDLSSERLMDIGGLNMTLGTANCLVKLAKEEVEKLVCIKWA